jgi:hypothetical protein
MSHALHLDGMKCYMIVALMVWIQICVVNYMCSDIIRKAHMQLENGT